jgi:hypothetical protein
VGARAERTRRRSITISPARGSVLVLRERSDAKAAGTLAAAGTPAIA